MRWLKHMTSTWDDEKIAAVVDELGLEGYGFWWRILEIIATQLDEKFHYILRIFFQKMGSFFNFSAKKKFEKFVKVFPKLRNFASRIFKIQSAYLCLTY